MNIQRFTAATSREALSKARMAFGDSTLILSNRPTENGVEVVATAEETLAALDQNEPQATSRKGSPLSQGGAPLGGHASTKVEDDADQLAMSTLSFQDYVRERMAKRRQETGTPSSPTRPTHPAALDTRGPGPIRIKADPLPSKAKPSAPVQRSAPAAIAQPAMSQGIVDELHAMKEMMEERFNTLAWLGQARQNPIQSNLMLRMIRAGYSPTLSRAILEKMPTEMDSTESMRWVLDVLERNLKTDQEGLSIPQEGGIFALIGATGVGKTTTTAKLAGLCADEYGPASVGLITLDTYRVGAHEQLRAYGKMLGVVAHLAHDRPALQDLLGLLSNKKMVLIDTAGVAPRDPRKRDMLDLVDLPGVRRILVLNAGSHGETLDESVAAFKTPTAQQVIFSKTDEAVKLGPAIDVAIRHQLTLRGVTNGQRVPEDWEAANAANLVRTSMRTTGSAVYEPKAGDLNFYFNEPVSQHASKGRLNA
ncbi:MAG: flagellar biosynthesis protein FlhF [Burkholderiales bacterium PBB4]|nr:MAG: flagellar biosynthesis protein FlhF [Burkholderiales bacterium PBB4]